MSYKGNIRTRNITMDKKWHYNKKVVLPNARGVNSPRSNNSKYMCT